MIWHSVTFRRKYFKATMTLLTAKYTEITSEVLRNVLYGHWSMGKQLPTSESNLMEAKITATSVPGLPTPRQVRLSPSTVPGSRYGVFSNGWIPAGTEMGPYLGRIVSVNQINMNQPNDHMWEVFDERGEVAYFVDADTEFHLSWITCVKCARNDQEQNLELCQIGRDIYYRAMKDIPPDQELFVWYGSSHQMYMGVPGIPIDHTPTTMEEESTKPVPTPISCSGGKLKCVICRRGFNSRSNLRSHMRIHTMEKPFVCKYCSRRFSQSSTLRNHVRLHTGEKPYRCLVCQSSYSQLAGLRAHQKSSRHKPLAQKHAELNGYSNPQ